MFFDNEYKICHEAQGNCDLDPLAPGRAVAQTLNVVFTHLKPVQDIVELRHMKQCSPNRRPSFGTASTLDLLTWRTDSSDCFQYRRCRLVDPRSHEFARAAHSTIARPVVCLVEDLSIASLTRDLLSLTVMVATAPWTAN